MTWSDNLRRVTVDGRNLIGASFRGVAFFVDDHERGGGRRLVTHEFPFRDDPFIEDMGKKARSFKIDGYVVGDDYLTQRDALISALEDTEGPGELVHPYLGVKRAICGPFTVRESRTEGRYAAFSIEFQETPLQVPLPTTAPNATDQVSDSADAANAASDAEFQSGFNPSVPGFALASAQTALTNALAAVKSKLGPIITATQEAAQLSSALTIMTAEAAALVTEPSVVIGQFRSAITGLLTTISSAPGDVMNALIDAYSIDFGPTVAPTTPTRAQEAANQAALVSALQRVFLIEAARLAPIVPFSSIEDATDARDTLVGLFDAQVATAGDVAYPSLVDLRSQLMLAVPGSTAFPSIVTVTRKVTVPSLLLTYQLYGSVDLEPDVIARNDIANPCFVSGELEVLNDGS